MWMCKECDGRNQNDDREKCWVWRHDRIGDLQAKLDIVTKQRDEARHNVAEIASRESSMRRTLRKFGIDPNKTLNEDMDYLVAKAMRRRAKENTKKSPETEEFFRTDIKPGAVWVAGYAEILEDHKREINRLTAEREVAIQNSEAKDKDLEAAYCVLRQIKDAFNVFGSSVFTRTIESIDAYLSGKDKYSGVYDELAAKDAIIAEMRRENDDLQLALRLAIYGGAK